MSAVSVECRRGAHRLCAIRVAADARECGCDCGHELEAAPMAPRTLAGLKGQQVEVLGAGPFEGVVVVRWPNGVKSRERVTDLEGTWIEEPENA